MADVTTLWITFVTYAFFMGSECISGELAKSRHKKSASYDLDPLDWDNTSLPFGSILPKVADEKRLTRFLVESYEKVGIEGRPVLNATTPMRVWFGLAIMQMDLDERENRLTTSVWCRIKWRDQFLRWNPEDYGGITRVRLSSKKIWIPDIMLYNTADTQIMEREVLIVAHNDGTMLWIPHRIYRSSCKVNVVQFPFDHQICHMTFGSWAYHGNELDLQFHDDFERMDLTDLERENTEWEVLHKGEKRRIQYYDCCKDPWVTLTFSLQMKRKLVFSTFILTLPCIFLACMTLVVFWLPPERPDRTGLAMSLFASFLLLLLILVEAAPPTASSVPTLGIYYCFNMVLIMLSIFLSSVVINVSRKGGNMEKVPTCLRKMSSTCLGKLLCLPHTRDYMDHEKRYSYGTQKCLTRGYSGNSGADTSNHSTNHSLLRHHKSGDNTSDESSDVSQSDTMTLSEVNKVCRSLQSQMIQINQTLLSVGKQTDEILNTMKGGERQRLVRRRRTDWQNLAVFLDRTCFFLFIAAIVTSLMLLFPMPQNEETLLT